MLELRYKTILAVALPMMISGFIQSIVLITDAAFISRYSTEAFDAVGNGGLIYITMYMCLLGMGDGAQIIIARRIGEERPEAIGRIFGSSVLMNCLLAAVLFGILYFIMPGAILGYSKNQEIAALQGDYIQIRSFALFFSMITIAIQAFFLAKGRNSSGINRRINYSIKQCFFRLRTYFWRNGITRNGIKRSSIGVYNRRWIGNAFSTSLFVFLR